MGETTIALVAAMPDEIRALLRRVGKYRKGTLGAFTRYDFEAGNNSVVLVQSGMGLGRAGAATCALLTEVRADLVVNFGFAGAVRADTAVGELVLAREVFLLEGERFTPCPVPPNAVAARAMTACGGTGALREGAFVTSAAIEDKRRVAALLPAQAQHPVLEMETAAVVAAARQAGVPVVAIRCISDGAEEELGFSLEEFCDAELNVRPGRVLATVARKPWIVPQLIRLALNSGKAARRLAECIETLLKGV